MGDELRPEDLWQGLSQSSRDIFSDDDIVSFLEEWSDSESFVEDLNHLVDGGREFVRPEEVFEHLAGSGRYYTVDEMLDMAEEASNGEWTRSPEISGTGEQVSLELGDKVEVPGEKEFFNLSDGCFGKTELEDDGKDVWMVQHEDYFQFDVSPLSLSEVEEVFTSFEELAPSLCFHEVEYGDGVYNLNSEDLSYFFEFRDEIDEFDGQLYRIESTYNDFVVEISKVPNEDKYEVATFSWRKTDKPIEAVYPVLRSELVAGLKTKLMLQYINEQ